jgi:LacI family transcriptional regulator
MTVKMKDIARELGVSIVTVSKALRKHPDISKATRERVEAKARDLNYHPNLAARSLVTGRSALIGLIVPDLIHPFFADVAKGLSLALREHGYFLIISSSDEDPMLEQQEVDEMLAHRLDAIVVASCATDTSGLARVQQGETPLILVDRMFEGMTTHFVGSDDYAAGKLATEHLLAIGCKRIAHIRGPENSTGRRRLKGFLDTMAKHNRLVPQERVVAARSVDVDGKLHGANALRVLSSLKRPPDGSAWGGCP